MTANLTSAKIFQVPQETSVLSFTVFMLQAVYLHASLDSVRSKQILAFLYDQGDKLHVFSLLTKFKQKDVVIFPMAT